MAKKTDAQIAQEELDAINEAKAQAQAELDATNEAKAKADAELVQIDEQIDEANTTLDATNEAISELSANELKALEKEANQPSADKYEEMAKARKEKGKNGKPLIGKGTGFEITLNK